MDVGSGYGTDLKRFVTKHPDAQGRRILQDQAQVVEKSVEIDNVGKMSHDYFN